MRTNTLLTVLVVVLAALAVGCETPRDLKSEIVGTYKGFIFNDEEKYPANTTFKLDGDKLSGEYSMDIGHEVTGELSEFTIIDGRKVHCKWIDHASRQGDLKMTFSPDLTSFEGTWNDDGMDEGSAWNGKKLPPTTP